jgi:hypothetical protein
VPIDRDPPAGRVVEAHQEIRQRRLPRTARPDDRHRLTRRDRQRDSAQHQRTLRAVAEAQVLDAHGPGDRLRQGIGVGGIGDLGRGVQQLEDALRSAGRLAQLAVDAGQRTDRPGDHDHVDQRRDELAGRESPGGDLPRAEEQDAEQGQQPEEGDQRSEEGAHAHPAHREDVGLLDARAVPFDFVALACEGLHRSRPGDRLLQHRRRRPQRGLCLVREFLESSPEKGTGDDDRRGDGEDDRGKPPVDREHQHERADEEDRLAQ